MPTSSTTESGVFVFMPLSDITTAALRIAESATVDVPIIGQILSSVVHIVELAEVRASSLVNYGYSSRPAEP